jgi:hypothetical protein
MRNDPAEWACAKGRTVAAWLSSVSAPIGCRSTALSLTLVDVRTTYDVREVDGGLGGIVMEESLSRRPGLMATTHTARLP